MSQSKPPLRVRVRERYKQWTAGLRTLPDFLILGAAKAGTSSLYALLCQHPQVLPASRKEVHYFDWGYDRGLRWYRSFFPLSLHMRLKTLALGRPAVCGEGSPYYLFHPHSPRRIAGVLPGAKLIALLRDPVDRAYSHYQHNLRHEGETLSFEEAIEREAERIHGERERMLADEHYNSERYRVYSYLTRGIYVDQLAAYHQYFPREQLLVLRAEDFFRDPGGVCARTVEFLGLGPWEPVDVTPVNQGHYSRKDEPIFQRLRDHFAPHNRRLYDYLQIDFGW
jgi:hypothetical protein